MEKREAGVVRASWRHFSQIIPTKVHTNSRLLAHEFSLKIIYIRLTAVSSLGNLPPPPILLPAFSSFLVFDVLSEVSSDSWRKRAQGECRGKSTTEYQREKKRERNERKAEKQGVPGERQSGRSKKKRTSLSGRLFLEVGRERASRSRLVEWDVCL